MNVSQLQDYHPHAVSVQRHLHVHVLKIKGYKKRTLMQSETKIAHSCQPLYTHEHSSLPSNQQNF